MFCPGIIPRCKLGPSCPSCLWLRSMMWVHLPAWMVHLSYITFLVSPISTFSKPMISFIKASGCGAGLHLWPCLKAIQQNFQSVELSYKSISSATEQLCLLQSMCGLSGVFLAQRSQSVHWKTLTNSSCCMAACYQHTFDILLEKDRHF